MSQNTSSSKQDEECVLKCKDSHILFNFPSEDIFRSLWLYKLGLGDSDSTTKVCDGHFSAKMFTSTGKELIDLAVPDRNLPDTSGAKKEIYEQLIQKITSTSSSQEIVKIKSPMVKKSVHTLPVPAKNTDPTITLPVPYVLPTNIPATILPVLKKSVHSLSEPLKNTSPTITSPVANALPTNIPATILPVLKKSVHTLSEPLKNTSPTITLPMANALSANIPATISPVTNVPVTNPPKPSVSSTVNDWLNDSSNFLMDYQLRVQGKHMCDVIEIPQYIVVFTVCKPKDLKKGTTKDLIENKSMESTNHLLKIPPSITVSQTVRKKVRPRPEVIQTDDDDLVPEDNQTTTQAEIQPEIDYVYYMTEEATPRREREVQVNILNETAETAIQCDVQLDNDMEQIANYVQVQWVESQFSAAQINLHECLICGEIVGSYSSKVKHATGHRRVRLLCQHCGKIFSNQLKLEQHERDFHSDSIMEMRKALRCPKLHCKKAFHSKKQLNRHINEHIRKTGHKCNKCMRLFNSSLKLQCHQKTFKNCLKGRWMRARR